MVQEASLMVPDTPYIDPRSIPDRSWIDPGSIKDRSWIDPRSILDRSTIDQGVFFWGARILECFFGRANFAPFFKKCNI